MHSAEPFVSKFKKRDRKNEEAKNRKKQPVTPSERITIAGRGTVVHGSYECDFCGKDVKSGWRYQSSVGPVIFCGPCKSHLLIARYGVGMPKPREIVTNFETKRSRH